MIEMSVCVFMFQARTSLGRRRFELATTNGAELLAVDHLEHPAVQLWRNQVVAELIVKPWTQIVLYLINLIGSERADMTLFGGAFRFGVGSDGSGRFLPFTTGNAGRGKTSSHSTPGG